MRDLSFSVIVVSHNRPTWLRRSLIAIDQLDYPRFEIVVVACLDGSRAAKELALQRSFAVITYTDANISKARNIGLSNARGDILAFIDDDAVPEPTWLMHLASAFHKPDIVQAGGTTLGRNGISVQHAACLVDPYGHSHSVVTPGDRPVEIKPSGDQYPRLHGTNMAFRRNAVWERNGFDPRFAFYLDESDLTLRISKGGGGTAFVPKAVVHHGTAEGRHRTSGRTPLSLTEIGASTAVFHRKHVQPENLGKAKVSAFKDRRAWLLRHMQIGTLTPDDVVRLLAEMEAGYADGLCREAAPGSNLSCAEGTVANGLNRAVKDICLVPTLKSRNLMRNKATNLVQAGNRVTVFEYSYTALFHRVEFTADGYWHHTGGIFGKEQRDEPLVQPATRQSRLKRALDRLKGVRARRSLQCE